MCCLGLYLESCGVLAATLWAQRYPHAGIKGFPEEAHWTLRRDYPHYGDLSGKIASTNDREALSEDEREERLVTMFAEAGIEVVFVDGEQCRERAKTR